MAKLYSGFIQKPCTGFGSYNRFSVHTGPLFVFKTGLKILTYRVPTNSFKGCDIKSSQGFFHPTQASERYIPLGPAQKNGLNIPIVVLMQSI